MTHADVIYRFFSRKNYFMQKHSRGNFMTSVYVKERERKKIPPPPPSLSYTNSFTPAVLDFEKPLVELDCRLLVYNYCLDYRAERSDSAYTRYSR